MISCILFCTFIPESPKWLKAKRNFVDLYEVLNKIGKMNGIKYLDKNAIELNHINKNCDKSLNSNSECCDETLHDSNFKLLEILWPVENLLKIIKLIILWNSNTLNYIGKLNSILCIYLFFLNLILTRCFAKY